MKQNRIFIVIVTLFFAQTAFISINAKTTLTAQEITAINLEQAKLQKEINQAVIETQQGKTLNINKADQVKRDVELAKKIQQYHLNKAKLTGRK